MVGTFISKYLLVTTSTITVTSSAAVTFFVAKHLKVGRNHLMAMDYVREQYMAAIDNKLEFENDEAGIISEIKKSLENMKSCISKSTTCKEYEEILFTFLSKFEEKQKTRRKLDNFNLVLRLANILGDHVSDKYNLEKIKHLYFPNDEMVS